MDDLYTLKESYKYDLFFKKNYKIETKVKTIRTCNSDSQKKKINK